MIWFEIFVGVGIVFGVARIISLLEKIANNTASVPMVAGVQDERATPHADDPRSGNHSFAAAIEQRSYGGHTYSLHGDGMVVARVDGVASTWRDEGAFKSWADRNQVPA